jgi:hypothetical protein
VLLQFTDAAYYMTKPVEFISVSWPNWYMLPCVAYVLHMVCETIYIPYQNLDKLFANGKKVFVKWPVRIELFKIKALDTPLYPTPVITCLGIWLNAVAYWAENFEIFRSVICKGSWQRWWFLYCNIARNILWHEWIGSAKN